MRIGGHLNWVFNVLPLGRPALTELYRKIAGKNIMGAGIALNADVVRNIEWLIAVIPKAIGVHFIDATRWDDRKADFVLWTDASLRLGLAFVYAGHGFTYAMSPSDTKEKVDIFFLELVAILSAVHHAALFTHPPKKVLLWTDSLDSVAAYSSLRAVEPVHNSVLLALSGILLQTGMDLRIRHIGAKTTPELISSQGLWSTNFFVDSLLTASASSLHHESFCRRDGGGAFRSPGRAGTSFSSPIFKT
jgi:hypothetical protein